MEFVLNECMTDVRTLKKSLNNFETILNWIRMTTLSLLVCVFLLRLSIKYEMEQTMKNSLCNW